jgi:hypothetical protein
MASHGFRRVADACEAPYPVRYLTHDVPMTSEAGQRHTSGEARHRGRWREIAVPLLAALLGSAIALAGGLILTNWQIDESRQQLTRQLDESQRQVARQIAADRLGRTSDERASTYGEFVSAADRHLSSLSSVSEEPVREADEEVFASLRLVQLRGSATATRKAHAIANRTRRLTAAFVVRHQAGRRDLVPGGTYFAQQNSLGRFISAVRPELRR